MKVFIYLLFILVFYWQHSAPRFLYLFHSIQFHLFLWKSLSAWYPMGSLLWVWSPPLIEIIIAKKVSLPSTTKLQDFWKNGISQASGMWSEKIGLLDHALWQFTKSHCITVSSFNMHAFQCIFQNRADHIPISVESQWNWALLNFSGWFNFLYICFDPCGTDDVKNETIWETMLLLSLTRTIKKQKAWSSRTFNYIKFGAVVTIPYLCYWDLTWRFGFILCDMTIAQIRGNKTRVVMASCTLSQLKILSLRLLYGECLHRQTFPFLVAWSSHSTYIYKIGLIYEPKGWILMALWIWQFLLSTNSVYWEK